MKRFYKLFVACLVMFILPMTSCDLDSILAAEPSASVKQEVAQKQNLSNAVTAYPTPQVENFMERKTIVEWTKRWDTPNKPCYCYIYIGSNLLGYFVTNGKPASTQSYLIPEYRSEDGHDLGESYGEMLVESPDVDGCYGSNNPGYRFFLANGAAIECSGTMVSCIYSDMPLSLSCPEITAVQK